MNCIQCSFCDNIYENSQSLKDHFKNDHQILLSRANPSGFTCKTNNCMRKFTTIKSLLLHIDKMHYLDLKNSADEPDPTEKRCTPSWSPTDLLLAGDITQMISDLRLCTNVTGADLGRVVDSLENVLSNIMSRVVEKIKEFLTHKNIDIFDDDQFDNKKTFSQYKTIHGQIQALKQKYTFIDATQIHLGNHQEVKTDKETGASTKVLVDDSFQYVPLIETLKLVLSNEEVFNYVNENQSHLEDEKDKKNNVLSSYKDGEMFKKNPFFKKYPNALGIHFYFDEFLVNNPVGSKTHGHKVGAYYYSIENLPPHLRNFIGNVHVLALCYNKDIKTYEMNEFLRPFLFELKRLESDSRVKVKINNMDYTLRCTILTLCADTLAAHEILGFLSPSANFFCRLCTISREEFKKYPWTIGAKRTKALHEKFCLEVLTDKQAASTTGVKFNSLLNELKYFHCTANYVFDIMHDILEGQGHYVLKLIIAKIIAEKSYNLNVDMLNHRINSFQYGLTERKNKPSATLTTTSIHNVSTDHKLQERAVQMWCFLRVFPFLVWDKVPEDDPYLQYLINLNRINEIVFSPKIPSTVLPYLHELIVYHVKQFKELFPNENPINKMHHMLHYAECIEESGPLRHRACFKEDAKHQGFKKYGSVSNNFKNIVKSMSNISQITQCSIWGTDRKEIRKKIQYTDYENDADSDDNSEVLNIFTQHNIQIKQNIKLVNEVGVYGNDYEMNLFLAIDSGVHTYKNIPIFGKIEKIFVMDEEVYFYCKEWLSEYLEENLNAYHIREGHYFRLISVNELCDPKPFSLWKTFSSELDYICLRHNII